MTKIMAVTVIPVLAFVTFIANQGPSQDAKSVAIDATQYATPKMSVKDEQRRREIAIQRASRTIEREKIEERKRRAKAKARAEAQAEREAAAEREAEAEAATEAVSRNITPSGNLPELLLVIREHESGGNYQAYNASGCEGYGCYGAYQLHGRYMGDWAARAGYGEYSSTPATQWPRAVQDAVALNLFNATGGGAWCDWTDYC